LAQSYNISPIYFYTNKTKKTFPKFIFNSQNVPLGNSILMCIGIIWGEKERGNHYQLMRPVLGITKCITANDKFIWNEEDSVYGIDIPVWIQKMNEAECSDEDCEEYCKNKYKGVFVNGVNKHVCYSYEILESICIIIKYDSLRNEYYFYGGCFPGNVTYKTIQAEIGSENDFNGVKIEIRDYADPIIQAGDLTEYEYKFGHKWRFLGLGLKILLLICLGIIGYLAYDIYSIKKKYKGFPNDMIGGAEDQGIPGGNLGFSI